MAHFTPIASLLGGLLIGLASALMLVLHGRIAGVSGIAGGALVGTRGDRLWRALFVLGLVGGGAVLAQLVPAYFENSLSRSPVALIAAGLLVGVGTQMGSGCTSGHGVCGLSRFSRRSLVAVATFMTTAAITVALVQTFAGGVL